MSRRPAGAGGGTILRDAPGTDAPGTGAQGRGGAPQDTAGEMATELAVVARASWPQAPGDTLTPIPAFVLSTFNPLAAEVADRCLRSYYGARPAPPDRGAGTAIVLASRHGDVGTGNAVAQALAEGRRVPPLLFFQSNVNAVAGHIAARWGLAGPVVCTCPAGDLIADGLECAALLIADGDASEALVIAVEHEGGAGADSATAVLVTTPERRAGSEHSRQEPGAARGQPG